MARQREEVLNVVLAQLICASGLAAAPESITDRAGQRSMPDVIVSIRGLRCAIEGKIDDVADARGKALKQAKERVDTGIAHMSVAVVYPEQLRTTEFSELSEILRRTSLAFLVYTESEEETWRSGELDTLLEDLRRSYQRLAGEDVVEHSVDLLRAGMGDVVSVMMSDATADRLAELLGVYEEDD